MPVPTHFRFTVRGTFIGTPETWSYGFHMSRDNPAGQDAGLGDIDEEGVDTAVQAFHQAAIFTSKVQVDDWRAYVIGTDGKMEGNAPLLHEYVPGTVVGTGSMNNAHPPQIATVVSTVAVDRGPAQYGRMYLPANAKPVRDDWRLSVGDATEVQDAAVAFLKAVSDSIDLELTQSAQGIHVSKGPVGSQTGTKQAIDHVRVGRVFDTVRNRRKSMLEEYVESGHIDW